jgi:hypothetical protein
MSTSWLRALAMGAPCLNTEQTAPWPSVRGLLGWCRFDIVNAFPRRADKLADLAFDGAFDKI